MHNKLHIGVLLGAGPQISSATRNALRDLISQIFERSLSVFNDFGDEIKESDLLSLVTSSMALLEDSEFTNAGRGSELTTDGKVECDASVILSRDSGRIRTFGSVGAVPHIANPIYLCNELIKLQLDGTQRSRSVPNFLVGDGAHRYALNIGLQTSNLITDRAQQSFAKWKKQLSQDQLDFVEEIAIDKYLDTVGIIAIYDDIHCVASSSGGSLLKDPGRVGPAAIIGSGLDTYKNISAVCSGFGEDINSVRLANFACTNWSSNSAEEISSMMLQRKPPQFGILRATSRSSGVKFEWEHTTQSMVCAIGTLEQNSKPKVSITMSKKPHAGGKTL